MSSVERFSREQKLLFCLMNAMKSNECSFEATSTAITLLECGIPCDAPSTSDGREKSQSFALLEFLHARFSDSMPEKRRRQEFAIFRLVLGAVYQAFLKHYSLSQCSTDEEIDVVYHRLKATDFPAKTTKTGLDKIWCTVLLKDILRHNSNDNVTLIKLLVCCGDLLKAEQLQKIGFEELCQVVSLQAKEPASDFLNLMLRNFAQGKGKCATVESFGQVSEIAQESVTSLTKPDHVPASIHSSPSSGEVLISAKEPSSLSDALQTETFENDLSSLSTAEEASGPDLLGIEIFKFAFEKVGPHWKELGVFLGFEKQELDDIEKTKWDLKSTHKAWEMLHRYIQDKGSVPIEFLQAKLDEAKLVEAQSYNERSYLPTCVKDDPLLSGRDGELQSIEQFLWEGKAKTAKVQEIKVQKVQVLCGIGGVGKTSLANRFAFRHASAYSSGIFHFNSESSSSLLSSLAKNLLTIELLENRRQQSTQLSQKLLIFFDYIRRNQRSLILFDSADYLELLTDLLPNPAYPCHIVITTRQGEESGHRTVFSSRQTRILTLGSLENEAAVNALLLWAGRERSSLDLVEQRFVRELACSAPVEGLPIAIAHAGTCVKRRKLSFRKYWERLQDLANKYKDALLDLDRFLRYFHLSHLKESLFQARVSRIEHLKLLKLDDVKLESTDKFLLRSALTKLESNCAFLTWEMDLDDIERESPEGYAVLSCCSLFASQDIPQEMVLKACFDSDSGDSKYHLEGGVRSLNEHSLIREVEGNDYAVRYHVHHLIQQSVVERLYKRDSERLNRLVKSLEMCFQKVLPSVQDLQACGSDFSVMFLSSHVYSVSQHILRCNAIDDSMLGLPDIACQISFQLNHLLTALELGSARICALESRIPSENAEGYKEKLRLSYVHMSHVCRLLDRPEESERWWKQVSQCRSSRQESQKEVETLELMGLARSFLYEGRIEEAEGLLLKMLDDFSTRKNISADHWDYLFTSLAKISQAKSDYHKMLYYIEKGLQLEMSFNGTQSLRCAEYFYQMGVCYKDGLDNPEKALTNFQKALHLYKLLSSKGNRKIAEVKSGIAGCEMAMGRADQALKTSEEALRMARSILPGGSPGLVPDLFWHAEILSDLGKYSECTDHLKECLSLIVSSCSVVDEHRIGRYLGKCVSAFYNCCLQADKLVEFVSYMEELLAAVKANYAPDHLFKAEIMATLGLAYFTTDHRRNPIALVLKESLEIYIKKLPNGHQKAVDCAVDLAVLLVNLHRFKEAAELLQRMTSRCCSVFPQGSEVMLKFEECWAEFYQEQEDHPDCVRGCIHDFE